MKNRDGEEMDAKEAKYASETVVFYFTRGVEEYAKIYRNGDPEVQEGAKNFKKIMEKVGGVWEECFEKAVQTGEWDMAEPLREALPINDGNVLDRATQKHIQTMVYAGYIDSRVQNWPVFAFTMGITLYEAMGPDYARENSEEWFRDANYEILQKQAALIGGLRNGGIDANKLSSRLSPYTLENCPLLQKELKSRLPADEGTTGSNPVRNDTHKTPPGIRQEQCTR